MIGTQIAKIRKKHQPFKHNLRYARAVTVCIAAMCQESGQPRIVLCSDTRLDYGDLGSTNTSCKINLAGWGWCSQLAGDWSGVNYLSSLIASNLRELPTAPSALEQIVNKADKGCRKFIKSPLFDRDETYQILLSGFISKVPNLLAISIDEGKSRIAFREPFATIGSGQEIANSMMSLREYEKSLSLQYASYLVYEAKRCSEKMGFVGKATAVAVQAPGEPEVKDRTALACPGFGTSRRESLHHSSWL